MEKSYFYCCSLPLMAGSVIKPGNWGRIIKTYSPQSSPNVWLFIRELIFEQVRRENFSTKPSRFESIFLCLDQNSIRDFKQTTSRSLDLIYEVVVLDEQEPTHIGDWALCNIQNNDNYSTFVDRAKMYWSGENIAKPELVTTSPIKIIQEV